MAIFASGVAAYCAGVKKGEFQKESMQPIPNSARPVVEILRRDVKRPISKPYVYAVDSETLWIRLSYEDFQAQLTFKLPYLEGRKFEIWADEADAAEAMEVIWPTKEKQNGCD